MELRGAHPAAQEVSSGSRMHTVLFAPEYWMDETQRET
jgi:hypothetical protein